jgi:hypothetical protein
MDERSIGEKKKKKAKKSKSKNPSIHTYLGPLLDIECNFADACRELPERLGTDERRAAGERRAECGCNGAHLLAADPSVALLGDGDAGLGRLGDAAPFAPLRGRERDLRFAQRALGGDSGLEEFASLAQGAGLGGAAIVFFFFFSFVSVYFIIVSLCSNAFLQAGANAHSQLRLKIRTAFPEIIDLALGLFCRPQRARHAWREGVCLISD